MWNKIFKSSIKSNVPSLAEQGLSIYLPLFQSQGENLSDKFFSVKLCFVCHMQLYPGLWLCFVCQMQLYPGLWLCFVRLCFLLEESESSVGHLLRGLPGLVSGCHQQLLGFYYGMVVVYSSNNWVIVNNCSLIINKENLNWERNQ